LFFFSFFQADSKLDELAKEDTFAAIHANLVPIANITVKALVANEELQKMLVRTGENDLMMECFIGECKAIINSLQQSPPAPSIKSEIRIFL
jgi:hypothetical protein